MRNVFRSTCAVFAVLAAWPVVIGRAGASEIVYVSEDGNVWLAAPDGSGTRPVTRDGTGDVPYRDPSLGDDGTISVLRDRQVLFLDRDGAPRRAPSLASDGGSETSSPPLGVDVSPAGHAALYWYLYDPPGDAAPFARATSLAPGLPGGACPTSVACHEGYALPKWIPGTRDFAAVQVPDGSQLVVFTRSGVHPWLENSAGWVFLDYDLSRAGNRLVAEIAPPFSQAGPSTLLYWENGTVPPLSSDPRQCALDGFATGDADVSWSPDGTAFTWSGPDGIVVSPAPLIGDAGCEIEPRLLVAGGSQPDWGEVQVTLTSEPSPTPTPGIVRFDPSPALLSAAAAPAVVSGLRIRPITFRARDGARVRYRASAPTTARFAVERVARGVRRGSACVKASRHARGRRCTRYVPVAGSWTRASVPGANSFRFNGRVDGRPLRPGAYRLTATATGAPARALFAIR